MDNPGHHDSLYNRGHGSLFGTASSQRLIRMADCRTCGPGSRVVVLCPTVAHCRAVASHGADVLAVHRDPDTAEKTQPHSWRHGRLRVARIVTS
ncbi:methyltransferase [Cutibacterium acnes JCM 18918]|nr:methyltransferase [Cutibacterium acnes JCM 18918]